MRGTPALLFLFCMAAMCARGAADELPAAATIEAKALAAAGPVAKNYRDTILGAGTLGDVKEITYHAGDDERTTSERGGFRSESGTYRGESWRQDENGLTFLVAKDPDDGAGATPKTTVERVTKPVDSYLVTEVYAGGLERRSYYDPATFHMLRRERTSGGVPIVTTYGEYAPFGNRTLPANWTIARGSESEHYRRDDYTIGTASDADVRMPSTARQLVEFPNGTSSVELPVSIIDNAVYVHASIGSRGLDFQLDTGASGIFIDENVARSLGLTLTNATNEIAAKAFTGYETRIPELHIGPLVMHDIVAEAVPMPSISTQGVKPVGLLGFDFLAELGVTIDYEHGKVRVAPAAEYRPPKPEPDTYPFDLRLGSAIRN